jgi:hypothetical protein
MVVKPNIPAVANTATVPALANEMVTAQAEIPATDSPINTPRRSNLSASQPTGYCANAPPPPQRPPKTTRSDLPANRPLTRKLGQPSETPRQPPPMQPHLPPQGVSVPKPALAANAGWRAYRGARPWSASGETRPRMANLAHQAPRPPAADKKPKEMRRAKHADLRCGKV